MSKPVVYFIVGPTASGKTDAAAAAALAMNGEVISSVQVLHGQAAEAPEAPAVPGYRFVGWDRDNFGCVTYSMVRTAVYEETGFCVPGDVDGDGVFSFTDISSLSLFLIGAGNIENELSADYNADGIIDFKDIASMYMDLIG